MARTVTMARMVRMQKKVGMTSHMVVMTFTDRYKEEIPMQLLRIKRGLDEYWQTRINGNPVLVVLMPFAASSAADGFFQRFEDWLQKSFGANSDDLHIQYRSIDLAEEDPVEVLVNLADDDPTETVVRLFEE